MKPIVAIVGRPNVGKSSFFNRLTGTKNALVDNFPGVTRDRNYGDLTWNNTEFTLIDTGGFIEGDTDKFAEQIRYQIHQAMAASDIIILMLDGKNGISPFDTEMIAMLRPIQKPVFYVINKIDSTEHEKHLCEFYRLGIDTLYPVSAEHGYGIGDFLDELVRVMPESDLSQDVAEDMIKLAVVGRPNVGKSSLINRLLGEERLVVSDTPGTTRDAVDSICHADGKPYLLIDTAGIRRKAKVSKKLEKFSVIKALKSLDRCDVALIILDAHEGITTQDVHIAGYAYERGCGALFLLNKWDLIEKKNHAFRRFSDQLRMDAKFSNFSPIMGISALTGLRVAKIFKIAEEIFRQSVTRIGTGQLNKILDMAVEKNEPPFHKGRRIKFYYTTQVSVKPPTFVCFVNYPEAVHFSYERYLINQIRENTGLNKVPIRMIFRQRTGRLKFGKK